MHLLVLLSLLSFTQAFGAYHFWNNNVTSYVTGAITYLTLPEAPDPMMPMLVLWPGLYASPGGILTQTLAMSAANPWAEGAGNACQGSPWCIVCSYYTASTERQTAGRYQAAAAGQTVMIQYQYDAATGNYTQWAVIDGATVSEVSSCAGTAPQWAISVESAANPQKGSSPAHVYRNSTVWFARPEPSTTFGSLGDTTYTKPTTTDGGWTWHIDKISIGSYKFI